MIDKETFEALKKNFKTEAQLTEEFERRKQFHKMRLGLGDEPEAVKVSELLALQDMESGDLKRIDKTAIPAKSTDDIGQTVEILAKKDPAGVLKFMDRLYKPAKKR